MMSDLKESIDAARETLLRVGGPTVNVGGRVEGIVAHIRKELDEIRVDPSDVIEYADVFILAIDAAWRGGASNDEIVEMFTQVDQFDDVQPVTDLEEALALLCHFPRTLHACCVVMACAKRMAADAGFDEAAFRDALDRKIAIVGTRKYPPMVEGRPFEHIREPT
jgi:hypothetical protein